MACMVGAIASAGSWAASHTMPRMMTRGLLRRRVMGPEAPSPRASSVSK
jgi:hypothetical protein